MFQTVSDKSSAEYGGISVILPCYNVSRWIDRCLYSITKQSVGLEKLEIICVDDKSSDNTLEKLKSWESRYPDNFVVIELEQNGRQGQARNIGLEYASYDWIGFIDSDDWVEPDYFKRMLSSALDGEYDLVGCQSERDFSKEYCVWNADPTNDSLEYIIDSPDERKPYIIHPPLGYIAWGKIIKKDFLIDNNLYFPINMTYEDAAWGSLLHLYVRRACTIKDKLYHYFVNDESTVLTRNSNHHLDCITSQTLLWREYHTRGFMDIYRNELEIEHIFSAYLPALKACILRYEKPDYNYYLLLRELMIDRIGDYKSNPYYGNGVLSDYHKLLLGAIDNQLNKAQFFELAEYIKQIGI